MRLRSAIWLSFCLGSIIPARKNAHPDFLDVHLHTPKLYFFLVILWHLKMFKTKKQTKTSKKHPRTKPKMQTTQAQLSLLSVQK